MIPEEIKLPYIYNKEKSHTLKHIGGDLFEFSPAEEWMPLYYTYADDGVTIDMIDTDGLGMAICVGGKVGGFLVTGIVEDNGKLVIGLSED